MAADCAEAVLQGRFLPRQGWVDLIQNAPLEELLAASARVMAGKGQGGLEFCSIHNVRSGGCSEDCVFCAQSARHAGAARPILSDGEEVLERARRLERQGVAFLSLVASGRAQSDADFDQFCRLFARLRRETNLGLCASLGFLTAERARRLREAGVTRYHNNLESSPSFFPTLCTTHNQAEKVATLRVAAEAGLELCSGGILGLGESPADRVDLALELARLGVRSVPLNVLMPIVGTPLAKNPPLPSGEILRALALFRLILPGARIRLAGGRKSLGGEVARALRFSADGLMTGDYLTTTGSATAEDVALARSLGLEVRS